MHPGYDFLSLSLLVAMALGSFIWLVDQGGQVGTIAGWVALASLALLFLGARL